MPTKNRRLVNFRNTQNFAYVTSKGKNAGNGNTGQTKWASCGKPPTENVQYFQQVRFVIQQNIFSAVTVTGALQTFSNWKPFVPLGFSKPCDPANANAVQNGWIEPTWSEVQKQYWESMKNSGNNKPMESV